MLLEEHHFTAPQRASPRLLSLSLASRSEDLQWMGGTFSTGPNDNRELLSTLPVTPRSGRNLLRGLADPRGRVGRRGADCESMWRGLWTLVSRAARGPHRWGDLGKGCDSVGCCSGPKPSPWDLGARFPAAGPPFEEPTCKIQQPGSNSFLGCTNQTKLGGRSLAPRQPLHRLPPRSSLCDQGWPLSGGDRWPAGATHVHSLKPICVAGGIRSLDSNLREQPWADLEQRGSSPCILTLAFPALPMTACLPL